MMEIINGILSALNTEFGDEYKKYIETVEQGFNEPCFIISNIKHSYNRFFADRFKGESDFVIQYFSDKADKAEDNIDVATKLFKCLEVIKAGNNLIRGTKMEQSFDDDVLRFKISYNYFAITEDKKTAMQNLKQISGVKG